MTWKGKGPDRLLQEGDRRGGRLVVLDREVDEAGGALDGDIQEALAALTVSRAQLGQVLHVHVHEADLIVLEVSMRATGAISRREAVEAFRLEDAVDGIPV